jgi:hypothetical protein
MTIWGIFALFTQSLQTFKSGSEGLQTFKSKSSKASAPTEKEGLKTFATTSFFEDYHDNVSKLFVDNRLGLSADPKFIKYSNNPALCWVYANAMSKWKEEDPSIPSYKKLYGDNACAIERKPNGDIVYYFLAYERKFGGWHRNRKIVSLTLYGEPPTGLIWQKIQPQKKYDDIFLEDRLNLADIE